MPANKFVIKAFDRQQTFKDNISINGARTYTIDLSPWAEENNNISTVTWTVKNGTASISNETLSSNVATALITFTAAENNLIEIKFDSGTQIYIVWLDIHVYDPSISYVTDY